MKENLEGDFDPPEGGYLKLALEGAELDMSKPLIEQAVAVGDETVLAASLAMADVE